MPQSTNYWLSIDHHEHLIGQAEEVFDFVWRADFTAPGFALLEVAPGIYSHTVRSWMVDLKLRLSEIGVGRGGGSLGYKSMGRFNQQETTKFHLDGAPDQSFLMLGYEPSNVRSRLFLADYTHATFDLGTTPQQFLLDFNPMYKKGEEALARYVTELSQPCEGCSRILVINNSSLPFTEARTNTLGVMHKAIIDSPDENESRIVNSTMLAIGDDDISQDRQQEFVATEKISQKVYRS